MAHSDNKKKAAIVILVRDCENTLPLFLKETEDLRAAFSDSLIVIVENNSKDGTKRLLEEYRSTHSGVMLDMSDDPGLDALLRIEKMAVLRNRCLDIVNESVFDPDLYIVIDGDLDFDPPSVLRAMENAPDDWAAIFANGRYYLKAGHCRIPVLYYDLFAYLPEERDPGDKDSLTEEEMLRMRPFIHKALRKKRFLKCRSAFGGVGIYRFDAVGDIRYAAEQNTVSTKFDHLCEHIPFNRGVSMKGSLYICRDLKVYYEPVSVRRWLQCLAADNLSSSEYQKLISLYQRLLPHRREGSGGLG